MLVGRNFALDFSLKKLFVNNIPRQPDPRLRKDRRNRYVYDPRFEYILTRTWVGTIRCESTRGENKAEIIFSR